MQLCKNLITDCTPRIFDSQANLDLALTLCAARYVH